VTDELKDLYEYFLIREGYEYMGVETRVRLAIMKLKVTSHWKERFGEELKLE
jgi:hypothetical protein